MFFYDWINFHRCNCSARSDHWIFVHIKKHRQLWEFQLQPNHQTLVKTSQDRFVWPKLAVNRRLWWKICKVPTVWLWLTDRSGGFSERLAAFRRWKTINKMRIHPKNNRTYISQLDETESIHKTFVFLENKQCWFPMCPLFHNLQKVYWGDFGTRKIHKLSADGHEVIASLVQHLSFFREHWNPRDCAHRETWIPANLIEKEAW